MVMPVQWTSQEQSLYDEITEYYREKINEWRGRLSVASWFPVITLQRQIASCIPATIEHYLTDSDDSVASLGEELSDIELEDFVEEAYDESEFLRLRDDPGLLQILKQARNRINNDSKFEELLRYLKAVDRAEPGRKILIFSYFKKTLGYLSQKLQAAGYSCVLVTGDVPSRPNEPEKDERGKRLSMFKNDPDIRIMLSSEVGSEGLDFQFAHILMNYDLPWNPMVVEQRIGRLDRLGQKSERILIYNFAIPGTIEERILGRLYARIRIFEQSIGDLESILGTEIRQLTMELVTSRLTPTEQEERIEECGRIIERRRQEMLALQREAIQFIGQDAYFQQELEEIRKNKRYVTAKELDVLIADFMANEFPASVWERDEKEDHYRLKLDKEMASLLRSNISKEDDVSDAFFVDRALQKPVRVTCDAELAFENEELVFINSRHKLVQTIVKYYETHLDRLHPVSCVELETSIRGIEPGDYVYFLYLIEHQSAKPGKALESVFVSISGRSVLKKDDSEILLSEMIVSARSLGLVEMTHDLVDQCYGKAEQTIGERIKQQREILQRTNEDIVTRRLASLEAIYRSKREKIYSRFEKATESQGQPQYIRMLEGTMRNLDMRYEEKVKEIEVGRRVDLQLELFGTGVVRIHVDG